MLICNLREIMIVWSGSSGTGRKRTRLNKLIFLSSCSISLLTMSVSGPLTFNKETQGLHMNMNPYKPSWIKNDCFDADFCSVNEKFCSINEKLELYWIHLLWIEDLYPLTSLFSNLSCCHLSLDCLHCWCYGHSMIYLLVQTNPWYPCGTWARRLVWRCCFHFIPADHLYYNSYHIVATIIVTMTTSMSPHQYHCLHDHTTIFVLTLV